MAVVVFNYTIIAPQPSFIYRLYDNPEDNQLIIVSKYDNKITEQDIEVYFSYVISIFDFKSPGSTRVLHYRKIRTLAEGVFYEHLTKNKEAILSQESGVLIVENTFVSMTLRAYPEDKQIFLVDILFNQSSVQDGNHATEEQKQVTFAVKKVSRKGYTESENIGGKYYGITLVDCSMDVLSI